MLLIYKIKKIQISTFLFFTILLSWFAQASDKSAWKYHGEVDGFAVTDYASNSGPSSNTFDFDYSVKWAMGSLAGEPLLSGIVKWKPRLLNKIRVDGEYYFPRIDEMPQSVVDSLKLTHVRIRFVAKRQGELDLYWDVDMGAIEKQGDQYSFNTPTGVEWNHLFYYSSLNFGDAYAFEDLYKPWDDRKYLTAKQAKKVFIKGFTIDTQYSSSVIQVGFNVNGVAEWIRRKIKEEPDNHLVKQKVDDIDWLDEVEMPKKSKKLNKNIARAKPKPTQNKKSTSKQNSSKKVNSKQTANDDFANMLDDTESITLELIDVPAQTNNSVLLVSGRVANVSAIDAGSILYRINGVEQEVYLNSNGHFSNKVVLFNGRNNLRVEYTSMGENYSLTQQIISHTRPVKARFTLVWDSSHSDMDLHVKDDSGNHVYFSNKSEGNMQLDVDNTKGYGPENISILLNDSSEYFDVSIRHYGGSSANVMLYIYLDNRLVKTLSKYLSKNRNWNAYRLNLGE